MESSLDLHRHHVHRLSRREIGEVFALLEGDTDDGLAGAEQRIRREVDPLREAGGTETRGVADAEEDFAVHGDDLQELRLDRREVLVDEEAHLLHRTIREEGHLLQGVNGRSYGTLDAFGEGHGWVLCVSLKSSHYSLNEENFQ